MFWFILAAILAGLDLCIKYYIRVNKTEGVEENICGGKVAITKFFNHGAMLGFLKNKAKTLLAISFIGLGILTGMLLMLVGQRGNLLLKTGLTMMLGGSASNVYERITSGKVTDYIRFNFGCKKFRRIIYNIGDFFIFIGAVLAAIGSLKHN